MNAWKQAALILACATAAAGASAVFHPLRPPWYTVEDPSAIRWRITLDEAREIVADGEVVWIDARPRASYEADHLPDALLLNTDEWGDLMFQHQEALQAAFERPAIVYCDGESCARSAEVAQRLRELLGLDLVFVLEGDWRELKGG